MNVGRPPQRPDALRVTLLGTGRPKPQPGRTGPAALVEAGGKRFVFDCGRCTLQRLDEAGVPLGELKYLFLTHLHSDHIVGIPDFWLTPWIFGRGNEPLRVWGPEGTRRMMSKLAEAFEFDIHLRRDVDERLDPGGVEVMAEDVEQGFVHDEDGLRITVFDVDHAPIKPAFGYRIDYAGRSAVLSGDTRYCENLIEFARGVDLLVHEVAAAPPEELQRSERLAHIIGHHTSPEEAASVFSQVKPKVAAFTHVVSYGVERREIIERTQAGYAGELVMGEDLMRFDITDEVTVVPVQGSSAGNPTVSATR